MLSLALLIQEGAFMNNGNNEYPHSKNPLLQSTKTQGYNYSKVLLRSQASLEVRRDEHKGKIVKEESRWC